MVLSELALPLVPCLPLYSTSFFFSIPMTITNNKGCAVAGCSADLNPQCPNELKLVKNGQTVGCKSDCLIDKNPANSPACCSGSHNTPKTCPSSGVPHYKCVWNPATGIDVMELMRPVFCCVDTSRASALVRKFSTILFVK
jgi:hypothetical protein